AWQKNHRGRAELMHGYGPTEATVVATIADLSNIDGSVRTMREVPIGYPIGNAQTYVLDTLEQPVPIGVAGELYIGGVGVARGYLKRAGLTAERFVPDPFTAQAGARLYKSGDLVRYRGDG